MGQKASEWGSAQGQFAPQLAHTGLPMSLVMGVAPGSQIGSAAAAVLFVRAERSTESGSGHSVSFEVLKCGMYQGSTSGHCSGAARVSQQREGSKQEGDESALRHCGRPRLPQVTQRLAPLGAERPPPGGTYVQKMEPSGFSHGGSRKSPHSCASAGTGTSSNTSRQQLRHIMLARYMSIHLHCIEHVRRRAVLCVPAW